MLPPTLNIALKEWAAVIDALRDGRQTVLLRKGGIYESTGEFEIEHRQFLLFPTYLHQGLEQIKRSEHRRMARLAAEPSEIVLDTAAEITDIVRLRSRSQVEAIDQAHIWAPPLIEMRFNYKPTNPLYLLIVRAFLLARPVTVRNAPEYAGCKSWVPFASGYSTLGTAAIDDVQFERWQSELRTALGE